MTRRTCVVCALAACMLATSVAAQEKPNFSGRWTSAPEPGGPTRGGGAGARAGDLGSGWGSTISVTQDASKLVVEYMFFARGDMQPPLKFVYALDGSETKNSVMMGRGIQVQLSRAVWSGDQLVITTVHTFPNPANGQPMTSEVKQRLSLESPTSLKVDATRSGVLGGPSSTTQTVYTKG